MGFEMVLDLATLSCMMLINYRSRGGERRVPIEIDEVAMVPCVCLCMYSGTMATILDEIFHLQMNILATMNCASLALPMARHHSDCVGCKFGKPMPTGYLDGCHWNIQLGRNKSS